MSGYLAGKVWQSDLDSSLKPLAAALADIASDDGTHIYPTVDYVAWLLGCSDRTVQNGIGKLEALGVLALVRKGYRAQGTRPGRGNEYRLIESQLPSRPAWSDTRRGEESSPLTPSRGETYDAQGCNLEHAGVKPTTRRGEASFTRSVIDPLEDPLVIRQPRARRASAPQQPRLQLAMRRFRKDAAS